MKEALAELQLCSRLEELTLKKISISIGDSVEMHSEKACLLIFSFYSKDYFCCFQASNAYFKIFCAFFNMDSWFLSNG